MKKESVLTNEHIEIISEVASKLAIKEYKKAEKEKKKEKRDWRLRNTKMLLKNYTKLMEHCKGVEQEVEWYADYLFDEEELNLHTLMKYKGKTKRIMDYVNGMLDGYKKLCEKSNEEAGRRGKVLHYTYIEEKKLGAGELAERFGINERTVYKDISKATEEFSVMLFGYVAIQDKIDSEDERREMEKGKKRATKGQ